MWIAEWCALWNNNRKYKIHFILFVVFYCTVLLADVHYNATNRDITWCIIGYVTTSAKYYIKFHCTQCRGKHSKLVVISGYVNLQ